MGGIREEAWESFCVTSGKKNPPPPPHRPKAKGVQDTLSNSDVQLGCRIKKEGRSG